MEETSICIYGSQNFFNLLKELNLFKDLNFFKKPTDVNKMYISIVDVDHIGEKKISSFINLGFPVIFVRKKTSQLKKNTDGNLFVYLNFPIEINSLVEIIKIIKSKFLYLLNSSIVIGKYNLDLHSRIIKMNEKKIKITQKELELILFLKKYSQSTRSEILNSVWKQKSILDSHAFETSLHRLRLKFKKIFLDSEFIKQENGRYSLL